MYDSVKDRSVKDLGMAAYMKMQGFKLIELDMELQVTIIEQKT